MEKELFTDSSAWFDLEPNKSERWGRKEDTYIIGIAIGSWAAELTLSKPGKEVLIYVVG